MHALEPLEAPVPPLAALRRIGFLLERARESTYKVEAYRKACATLAKLPADDIRSRAERKSLTDLAGIGRSTAGVVEQAVAGRVPTKLAELQDAQGPLVEGGEELFAAIQGDLHMHSDWSDGGSPVEEMLVTAMEVGQSWTALTDHSPRLTIANGLSAARLKKQLALVDRLNARVEGRFRLLKGIEVDILDDGSLDQTEEMLDRLDVVTASVHSKLKMERSAMTRRMVNAVRNPRVDVLGHCTGRLVTGGRGKRPESQFDARAVFEACAEHGTAVEINSRPERCDPPDELVLLALEIGCTFTIDSDAHAPGQLEMKAYGAERAERLGVPWDRILTTWDVDDVLEWTGRA